MKVFIKEQEVNHSVYFSLSDIGLPPLESIELEPSIYLSIYNYKHLIGEK